MTGIRRIIEGVNKAGRRVSLSAETGGSALLVARLKAGKLAIRPGDPPGEVRVEGGGDPERVRLRILDDERLGPIALVVAEHSNIEVRGDIRAAAVSATGSSITIDSLESPLDYVSARLAGSSAAIQAKLRRGGGLLASLKASVIKAFLDPVEPGEYWIDLEASSSAARIMTPPGASYVLEGIPGEPVKSGLAVLVAQASKLHPTGPVRFYVRVRASGASLKLE